MKVSALALVVLVSACATTPPVTQEDRVRSYAAPPESVFRAAQRVYADLGAEVTTVELAAGILNGRVKLSSEAYTTMMLGQAKVVYKFYQLTLLPGTAGTEARCKIFAAYADGAYPIEDVTFYADFWGAMDKAVR